jgi:hypothetical protein
MDERPVIDLARLYRKTRLRVMNLVAGLTDPELDIGTPACPAWTVRDIVARLTAIPEDAASGRLKGIPTDEFTAGQVARLGGLPVAEVLARWAALQLTSKRQSRLTRCGQRSSTSPVMSRTSGERVPLPVRIRTEDGEYLAGSGTAEIGELTLTTSRFEAFRRSGRPWRDRVSIAGRSWHGAQRRLLSAQLMQVDADGRTARRSGAIGSPQCAQRP